MTTLYVAGIDGGGTKTAAAILDSRGRVLGIGEGGPSTFGVVPEAVLRASIAGAVASACRAAGLAHAALSAAFLGLGNVVSDVDRQAVHKIAVDLRLAPAEKIGVDHDCRIALAGSLSARPGIVLIAGTGTSCFGMNAQGQAWRAGGWGPLIDDAGSGYWLGIQALRAAVHDYDGRGAPTVLRQQVSERLQLADFNALMNRLYVVGLSRTEIAAFAPLVFEAAQLGDTVAVGLIRSGCEAMADSVLAVARRLDLNTTELAVVGGLTKAGDGLFAPLKTTIQERLAGCRIVPAELPPSVGAGLLALALCGQQVDGIELNKIHQDGSRSET